MDDSTLQRSARGREEGRIEPQKSVDSLCSRKTMFGVEYSRRYFVTRNHTPLIQEQ